MGPTYVRRDSSLAVLYVDYRCRRRVFAGSRRPPSHRPLTMACGTVQDGTMIVESVLKWHRGVGASKSAPFHCRLPQDPGGRGVRRGYS